MITLCMPKKLVFRWKKSRRWQSVFAEHGRQAVVDTHGGMMSATGFYAALGGLNMLNVLAGSINQRGGMAVGGGVFNGNGTGPRYNLSDFPGKTGPRGLFLSRSRMPYENSSEYRRRVEAGENPYPANAPWRPVFAPPLLTEHLLSGPRRLSLSSESFNQLYGESAIRQAGLTKIIADKISDPKRLGLFVAVDGFINETQSLR